MHRTIGFDVLALAPWSIYDILLVAAVVCALGWMLREHWSPIPIGGLVGIAVGFLAALVLSAASGRLSLLAGIARGFCFGGMVLGMGAGLMVQWLIRASRSGDDPTVRELPTVAIRPAEQDLPGAAD